MSQAFLWQSFSHTKTDIYEMEQPFLTIFAHSYIFLVLIKNVKHFICTCRSCYCWPIRWYNIIYEQFHLRFWLITLRSSAKMYPDCKTTHKEDMTTITCKLQFDLLIIHTKWFNAPVQNLYQSYGVNWEASRYLDSRLASFVKQMTQSEAVVDCKGYFCWICKSWSID